MVCSTTEIIKIKNDYGTNTALTSRLSRLSIFKADYHSFEFVNSRYINYWKSKGIFNGTLDGVANSSNKKPDIHLAGETVSVNFNGNYFKQPKVDYNRSAIAIHIVYKLNSRRILSPDYVQLNGLFGNCKLTIIPADKRHYGYINGVCVFFLMQLINIMNLIQVKHIEIC